MEVGHRRSREITRERGRRWEKVKEGGPRVWSGGGRSWEVVGGRGRLWEIVRDHTGWWLLVVVCGVCGGRSREWSVGSVEGGGRVAEVMLAEVRW